MQVDRLVVVGVPAHLMKAVAESLLLGKRVFLTGKDTTEKVVNKKVEVITYVHGLSRNLNKVANRFDVCVFFSAPRKLASLCRCSSENRQNTDSCGVFPSTRGKNTQEGKTPLVYRRLCTAFPFHVATNTSAKQGNVLMFE